MPYSSLGRVKHCNVNRLASASHCLGHIRIQVVSMMKYRRRWLIVDKWFMPSTTHLPFNYFLLYRVLTVREIRWRIRKNSCYDPFHSPDEAYSFSDHPLRWWTWYPQNDKRWWPNTRRVAQRVQARLQVPSQRVLAFGKWWFPLLLPSKCLSNIRC